MKQTMPCPRCGKQHEAKDSGPRPDLAKRSTRELMRDEDGKPYPFGHRFHGVRCNSPYQPPDVSCDCGAVLRCTLTPHEVNDHGWKWRII